MLFVNLIGLTVFSGTQETESVMRQLNRGVYAFERYGVESIKTIRHCYMRTGAIGTRKYVNDV